MSRIEEPPEPWRLFFAEVDSHLSEEVYLHCCGGFVVTQLYGVARTTSDVDFLWVTPNVRSELVSGHRRQGIGLAPKSTRSTWTLSQLPRHLKITRNDWLRCSPAHGVACVFSRWKLTIWLFPNWSGILNVIATTYGNLHARAT
jgi:hypothetical protein